MGALFAADRESLSEAHAMAGRTADQRAMEKLRKMSEEFMPALAAIRNSAVDRDVLASIEEANTGNSVCMTKPNSPNSDAKCIVQTESNVASPARKRMRLDTTQMQLPKLAIQSEDLICALAERT